MCAKTTKSLHYATRFWEEMLKKQKKAKKKSRKSKLSGKDMVIPDKSPEKFGECKVCGDEATAFWDTKPLCQSCYKEEYYSRKWSNSIKMDQLNRTKRKK